jgi:hypothetical protein
MQNLEEISVRSWSAIQRARKWPKNQPGAIFPSPRRSICSSVSFLLPKSSTRAEFELFRHGGARVCFPTERTYIRLTPTQVTLFPPFSRICAFPLFSALYWDWLYPAFYPAPCAFSCFVLFCLACFFCLACLRDSYSILGGLSDNLSAAFTRCCYARTFSEREEWCAISGVWPCGKGQGTGWMGWDGKRVCVHP